MIFVPYGFFSQKAVTNLSCQWVHRALGVLKADRGWYVNSRANPNFCFTETAPRNRSWGLWGEWEGSGGVSLCSTTANCGLDSFFPNQITYASWFCISMQQAWENDKRLSSPLSWRLKQWLLWGSRGHRRRKAKTRLFLLSDICCLTYRIVLSWCKLVSQHESLPRNC